MYFDWNMQLALKCYACLMVHLAIPSSNGRLTKKVFFIVFGQALVQVLEVHDGIPIVTLEEWESW